MSSSTHIVIEEEPQACCGITEGKETQFETPMSDANSLLADIDISNTNDLRRRLDAISRQEIDYVSELFK